MKPTRLLLVLAFAFAAAACDKPETTDGKPPAAAAPSAPPPVPPPPPAPAPSATPAPAPASEAPPTSKEAVVAVRDPAKEAEKTVKVLAGGNVALYLPEWAGTSWKIAQPDKALGKAKEETIPGFAGPTTPAHAFTWPIPDALKGQSHKVSFTNGAAKGRPAVPETTFTLHIDAS